MNMHTPIFPYTNSGIIPNPDDTSHEVEQKVWQAIHNEFVAAAIAAPEVRRWAAFQRRKAAARAERGGM